MVQRQRLWQLLMNEKELRKIQKQNIKNLREVLERRLGKEYGAFLVECIIGQKGLEIEKSDT